jgi:hypothetical protein
MKRFIQGANRGQSTLSPKWLDDWIEESNPVRAVDAFVNALDLGELGFRDVEPAATTLLTGPVSRVAQVHKHALGALSQEDLLHLIDLNLEIYRVRHALCRVTRWLFASCWRNTCAKYSQFSRPSGPKRATMVRRRSRRS